MPCDVARAGRPPYKLVMIEDSARGTLSGLRADRRPCAQRMWRLQARSSRASAATPKPVQGARLLSTRGVARTSSSRGAHATRLAPVRRRQRATVESGLARAGLGAGSRALSRARDSRCLPAEPTLPCPSKTEDPSPHNRSSIASSRACSASPAPTSRRYEAAKLETDGPGTADQVCTPWSAASQAAAARCSCTPRAMANRVRSRSRMRSVCGVVGPSR